MALLTPRHGRSLDQHLIKLDQVPRWNEQEPSFESLRTGSNGWGSSVLSATPSEAELRGGTSGHTQTDPIAGQSSSTAGGAAAAAAPASAPLEARASRDSPPQVSRDGSYTSSHEGSYLGDSDIRRTYSNFVDPLTEKQRGGKAKPGSGILPSKAPSKFPVDARANSRVLLWRGEPWNLEVDVVVSSTNETLDESASSPGLHLEAGPGLAEECAALGGCRTGEVKVSGPHALAARQIFHTVGPQYIPKYHTAAENALSSCYRTCLEVLVEMQLHSIAFPCLYSEAKGYPREQAAHVAMRTVRRFLEKYADKIMAVVFCLQTDLDNDIYKRVLPLYFPRDKAEEDMAKLLLPADTGDETGGALSLDRQIRIVSNLPLTGASTPKSSSGQNGSWGEPPESLDAKEFLQVAADPDERRKEQWAKSAAAQANGWDWVHLLGLEGFTGPRLTLGEEFVLHQRYLAHAMKLDFTQLQEMRVVVRGGVDMAGRQVVAIIGAHFLPRCMDLDSFVLFMVKELDAVMHRPFCIVYYHAAVNMPAVPNFAWVAKLHHVLGPRHRRNLQAVYVVHPTLSLRTAIWALQTFIDPVVWSKVVYITRLVDLFRYVPRDQVTLPEFVIMHDIETNPNDAITISYQVHSSNRPRGLLLSRDF